MKALLKKNKEGSLHCRLANALLYCRTTPHAVTKVAPCFALNGRKFITLKDKINPLNISLLSKKEGKKVRSFNVGDYVLALNYGRGPKWYHGVIIEKININIFKVRISDLNVVWRRHSNQLLSSVNMKNEHDTSHDVYDPEDNVFVPLVRFQDIPDMADVQAVPSPCPSIISSEDETSAEYNSAGSSFDLEQMLGDSDSSNSGVQQGHPSSDQSVDDVGRPIPRRSGRQRKPVDRLEL